MPYTETAQEEQLEISGFVNDSIVDGPGLRFTVFGQGCPHHCKGCHNPQTWAFGAGERYTPQAVFEKIQANSLVKGVTFSGGEPFAQCGGFAVLGQLLQKAGYEVACYTGYTFEQLLQMPAALPLLKQLDVLVDGPFIEAQKDLLLSFRGSANQRILDVPKSLAAKEAVLYEGERWQGAPRYIPRHLKF
ncbi:MAG: anaerobic ribonucleoside-triphosphate reductase activating protein [Oscillospiraceae bacterium]|nr:anaerobic ribonucleoside-triphosphate reductase activating protein [Oscillospiraceae bacterium]